MSGDLINWSISFSGPMLKIAGTNNYMPKWLNGNLTSASNLFDKGTNVDIVNAFSSAKLDVTGCIKIADGSQGPWKILTSDASGIALWQEILFKNGVTSRNFNLHSGVQTIPHGLGKISKKVKFTAMSGPANYNISIGVYNGTNINCSSRSK